MEQRLVLELLSNNLLTQLPQLIRLDPVRSERCNNINVRVGDAAFQEVGAVVVYTKVSIYIDAKVSQGS
jgi:hypothetical protein